METISAVRRLECDAYARFGNDGVKVASNWMPHRVCPVGSACTRERRISADLKNRMSIFVLDIRHFLFRGPSIIYTQADDADGFEQFCGENRADLTRARCGYFLPSSETVRCNQSNHTAKELSQTSVTAITEVWSARGYRFRHSRGGQCYNRFRQIPRQCALLTA